MSIAEQRARVEGSLLVDFSLFSLPIQTQAVYSVLLMIPIGALIMVVMRNIIGIDAFGTFMPVLIALSFRETQLSVGRHSFHIARSTGTEHSILCLNDCACCWCRDLARC